MTPASASLVSLNVGLPKPLAYRGKHVPSGFRKSPVSGSVWLDKTNLQGDAQADLKNHGGPEKAVCVYPLEYYPYWEGRLGRTLAAAAFGELLRRGAAGAGGVRRRCLQGRGAGPGALVQVSQPRQPCFKLAARYGVKELALWTQETGLTGFYFRVLEEGEVRADDEVSLLERTAPEASVAEANRVMHLDKHDVVGIERVLAVPELSANWRRTFEKRLSGHTEDTAPRLEGSADRRRDRVGAGEQ